MTPRADPRCPRCAGKGRRLIVPRGHPAMVVWCECVPREDIEGRWDVPAWAQVPTPGRNRDD